MDGYLRQHTGMAYKMTHPVLAFAPLAKQTIKHNKGKSTGAETEMPYFFRSLPRSTQPKILIAEPNQPTQFLFLFLLLLLPSFLLPSLFFFLPSSFLPPSFLLPSFLPSF